MVQYREFKLLMVENAPASFGRAITFSRMNAVGTSEKIVLAYLLYGESTWRIPKENLCLIRYPGAKRFSGCYGGREAGYKMADPVPRLLEAAKFYRSSNKTHG